MSIQKIYRKIHSIYTSVKDKPFLVLLNETEEAQEYSYSKVIDESLAWRKEYRCHGLQAKDNILVILPHSLNLYTSYLAAVLGGMPPSMFSFPSPKYSKEIYFQNIEVLIKQANPRLIVTYPELKNAFQQYNPKLFHKELFLTPEQKKSTTENISLNLCEDIDTGDSSPAFYQYSSGTTGIKKSVAITHQMLLWQIENYLNTLDINPEDRIVSWLPLYHDMGLIASYWLPLLTGIPIIALSPFDWVRRPASLLEAIEKYRGTHCWQPNFAYNHLAKHVSETQQYDLSSIKAFINCSEPIIAESHDIFLQRFQNEGLNHDTLWASYAMAESTFAVTSGKSVRVKVLKKEFTEKGLATPSPGNSKGEMTLLSSGKILPTTTLKIVDEKGLEVEDRKVGEIVIQSPCLVSGYCHDHKGNVNFGSWGYKTGDLGFLLEGELFVTGRKKDLIIIGGKNIYPQDIENLVNNIYGIVPGRCVAFGVSNEKSGTEELIILAETKNKGERSLQKIQQKVFLAVAAGSEVVANDVLILPHMTLLKSSSGKIARAANREKYLKEYQRKKGPPTDSNYKLATEPSSLEESVQRIIVNVLKEHKGLDTGAITSDQALLTSGIIDSFLLVNLIIELEKKFSLSIPIDKQVSLDHFNTGKQITQFLSLLKNPKGKEKFQQSLEESIRSAKTKSFLSRKRDIETLILGSSRIQGMSAKLAGDLGTKAYNFSVNSAGTEDWYCLLNFVLENQAKTPQQVFVGIDVEAFHPHYTPDHRLLENAYLRKYLDKNHMNAIRAALIPDIVPMENREKFQDISLKISNKGVPHEQRYRLEAETGDFTFIGSDTLSQKYNSRTPLKLPHEKVVPADLSMVHTNFNKLGEYRIKYLLSFVSLCVRKGIEMLFFHTPIHPVLESALMRHPVYAQLIKDINHVFQALGISEHHLLDCSTPEKFGGDPDDFITDGAHIGTYNADLLLRHLIKHSSRAPKTG